MNYIKREQLGVTLLIFGLTFGWILSALLSVENNGITRVIIFASILPFIKNLRYILKKDIKPILLFLLLYQLIIITLAIDKGKVDDYIYHFYLFIVITFLIFSDSNEAEIFSRNRYYYLIGIFINFMLFVENISRNQLYNRKGIGYTNNYPVIAFSILAFLFYSLFFYNYKSRLIYIVMNVVLIVVVLINVLSAVSRTAILGFILVIVIYFFKTAKNKERWKKKFIFFMIVVIVMIIFNVPELRNAFNSVEDIFTRGIKSFIGLDLNYKAEVSALTRRNLRIEAFKKIQTEMNFKELLFGFGYKDKYLDFPVLQIFMDLGIVGSIPYYIIYIIYPILKIIRKREYTFLDYIFIMNLLNFISVGQPYVFIKLVPVVIWYSFSEVFKEKQFEKSYNFCIRNKRII